MFPHFIGVRRVDDEQPAIVEAVEDRVVLRAAGIVAENIVTRLPLLHRRDGVNRQRIGPLRNRASGEPELPHMGKVEEAGAMPHGVVLFEDARVLHRHLEAAERHEARAGAGVIVVERGSLQILGGHGSRFSR